MPAPRLQTLSVLMPAYDVPATLRRMARAAPAGPVSLAIELV